MVVMGMEIFIKKGVLTKIQNWHRVVLVGELLALANGCNLLLLLGSLSQLL